MNNEWIKYSDRRIDPDVLVCDHEDWLDYLNLYETSWILFVWSRNNSMGGDFGWPGKEHE